ncbi:MAG: lycopene cyclase family protein [Polyangia bacterium]
MIFDFALVGAGVSGLCLAWLLADALADPASPLHDRSILLIDGAEDEDELRALSFWSRGDVPLEPLVRHSWRTLKLSDGEQELRLPLREHSYRTLFFADLQRETKARLNRHPQHRLVRGRLQSLVQANDGGTVSLLVDGTTYEARWVFDSRFRRSALRVDTRRWHLVQQHIRGWIVRTEHEAFDPEAATFIDFRELDAGSIPAAPRGTRFVYTLPFSRREALVEIVSLAPIDAAAQLRAYLRQVYGVEQFTLVAQEGGASPLTEMPFEPREGARVRRIGIASGCLKPSTGYALTRILDEAAAILRSLERYGDPFHTPRRSRIYRLLDGVLLELWEHEPALVPSIFLSLFARNPPDRVLRFLDERAGAGEVLRLIASLPALPFLRAAGRWIGHRLGLSARPALPPPNPPPALPPTRAT